MDFLSLVRTAIHQAIGQDNCPIVIFSSAWPFLKEMHKNDILDVENLLDILMETAGTRSILMPSFTRGFTEGICNLDIESSSTGVLSECFRKRPGVRRTLSAFFPFAISGPDIDEVINLKPKHAWGEGSIYEWMEQRNVCFLMFGTHPTHCSYLHRLEWLAKSVINYRFDKVFSGKLIREGVSIDLEETLFVRKLDPPVVNDFTVLMPFLESMGMKLNKPRGVSISSYHPNELLAQVLPIIRRDPFFTVKNRKDYEEL